MRKLLIIGLVLLSSAFVYAQISKRILLANNAFPANAAAVTTPTLVQSLIGSGTGPSSPVTAGKTTRTYLPNPTLAGNALIAFITSDSTTITVADDQTNTWVQVATVTDNVHSDLAYIWAAYNIHAGTQLIWVTNSAAGYGFSHCIFEFAGITNSSAADGTSSLVRTNTVIASGNITPTQTGDLIIEGSYCDQGNHSQTSYTEGSQANITWHLAKADVNEGFACQWGIYNSSSTINPTFSQALSKSTISISAAFKATLGAGTTRGSGMKIVSIVHSSQTNNLALTQNLQIPTTTGNLLVAAFASGGSGANFFITNMTDTAGNTWQQVPGTNFDGAVGGAHHQSQWWYAANATPSSANTITVKYKDTSGGSTGDGNILWYEIVGANSSPYDSRSTNAGDQTIAGNLSQPPAITPSAANGVILMMTAQAFNTVSNLVSAGTLDSLIYDGMSLDGPQNYDQNNGWAHYYNPDTSAYTITWKYISTTEAARQYGADATTWKP